MTAYAPEQLYVPSPKDLGAQFAPVAIRRSLAGSAAATAVSLNSNLAGGFTVPNDYVLVIDWLQVGGAGAPGQNCTRAAIDINDEQQNLITRLLDVAPAAGQSVLTVFGTGKTVLFSGESIFGSTFFDLGAAANSMRLSWSGLLVPRGNWQRA